jgi:hypothetical protein
LAKSWGDLCNMYDCSLIHPPYECDCLRIPPHYCMMNCMMTYVYVT